MTKKGFVWNDINLIKKLCMIEITFEEYSIKRGLSKYDNFYELKYIVNDNQILLDNFLSIISIGMRSRAMKGLFDLTNKEIEGMTNHSENTIAYFISENMTFNKDSEVMLQRNSSNELTLDLAIILDLPFWYLAYTYTKYTTIDSFREYERPNISIMRLHELIGNIIESIRKPGQKREIFGVKIINEFFEAGEKKHLCTRVDIREKFFTIEIYLEDYANINPPEILKLENSIGINNKIYIRNAFLRINRKLIILISIDESVKPSVTYLHDDFLWRNVLFNLKNETIKKLKKEELKTFE